MEDDEHATTKMENVKLEDAVDGDAQRGFGNENGDENAYANANANANAEAASGPGSTPKMMMGNGNGHSPLESIDDDAAAVAAVVVKSRSGSAETPGSVSTTMTTITTTTITTKTPRLSRKASAKTCVAREAPLYDHLPDVTGDSCRTFQVISDCLYGSKHLGSTDNDALDCDCREEFRHGENFACGEDSDCINRATKMECSAAAGNCGGGCHNQRFQRKQYASVTVIKTEKKGYGLRADANLQANDFIFEYIGEVINEPTFRRRMLQYDQEGIKHFYFMSLNKNEFVDATKKGNLGRFCNHSCNPNCFVDKWVVGDKLRMGIFALRSIRAGEELVFNYNVDRYGAEPQPCYCGEVNCVGFIGGKTQTERATKLPTATVEALGIDDGADGWDVAVAKKPRKKRPDEDDEEYISSIQPRSLTEDDSRKVMATLMQCKEKWIAVKLLERILRCDEERVIHCVMRMHAYQIFKTTLNTFLDDHNVVLQVLSILDKFPRLTRNKIQDSNIEATVQTLADSEHEDVASRSRRLLDEWSKLEVAYRIRRRKLDPNAPNAPAENIFDERRGAQAREDEAAAQQSASKTASPAAPIDAPKGPRSNIPQRNNAVFYGNGGHHHHHHHHHHRQRRGPFGHTAANSHAAHAALPAGWFTAKDAGGNTYFYNKQGTSTWHRPTQPASSESAAGSASASASTSASAAAAAAAAVASKIPSKALQEQLAIQNIIARVTKDGTPKPPASQPPNVIMEVSPHHRDAKREKWRSLPLEKQMKLYEHTVFPPIKHVLDKFRHKLPKDDLKRLGKDVAKKVVASDFKNNRVGDPGAGLSEKQERNIKKYVKDFLDRAVEKYEGHHQRRRTEAGAENGAGAEEDKLNTPTTECARNRRGRAADEADDVMTLSDADLTPGRFDRKRKRDAEVSGAAADLKRRKGDAGDGDGDDDGDGDSDSDSDGEGEGEGGGRENGSSHSGSRSGGGDGAEGVSPPPPPPPPPQSGLDSMRAAEEAAEEAALQEQEEALMRENEEAQRLDDEEQARRREAALQPRLSLSGQPTTTTTSLDEHGSARKRELMSH